MWPFRLLLLISLVGFLHGWFDLIYRLQIYIIYLPSESGKSKIEYSASGIATENFTSSMSKIKACNKILTM